MAAKIAARDAARAKENADLVSKLQSGSGMMVGGKEVDSSEYATDVPFDSLKQTDVGGPGIPEDLLASLRGVGFRTMSAIQQQSLAATARVTALDLLFGHAADSHRQLDGIYAKLTPMEVSEVAQRIFSTDPVIATVLPES